MTKTPPKITKAEVKKALRTLIVNQSDTVNPTRLGDPSVCAYHRGRGANIKRCIAGQIGYDFGLPTPDANAGSAGSITRTGGPWGGRFTDGARLFLAAAQLVADNGYGKPPLRWGDITFVAIEQKIANDEAWIED